MGDRLKEAEGLDDQRVFVSAYNLSQPSSAQGRYSEAEPLVRLAIRESLAP